MTGPPSHFLNAPVARPGGREVTSDRAAGRAAGRAARVASGAAAGFPVAAEG
ncbi:hypothetical protein ACWGE1_39825 [Streptomyces sp. NPDC054932]